MPTFNHADELRAWLLAAGVNLSAWGQRGAKTVANLWDEVNNGEAMFQDDPLCRVIEVVQVIIRQGNRSLIEVEQEMVDGSRRQRCLPLSEKMYLGEDYAQAAHRGLQEELNVDAASVSLDTTTHLSWQEVRESPSYPGLNTKYVLHRVEAHVVGLPDEDFWRDNAAVSHGDPVRRQCWGWRPVAKETAVS